MPVYSSSQLFSAISVDEYEHCGLIMGKRRGTEFVVFRLLEVPNIHPTPQVAFKMRATDAENARRRSLYRMLGYWHTHPVDWAPGPSSHDLRALRRVPHHIGLVFSPPTRIATWYSARGVIHQEVIEP